MAQLKFWPPRNLDLEVSGFCNMNCPQCYLNKLDRATRGHMSMEVAEQVLQYVELSVKAQTLKPHVSICFFGGEPFLNFPVVQYIVEEAKKRNLPIGRAIMTNGASATDEQIRWCREQGIISKRSTGGCPEATAFTRPGDYMDRYHAETKLWGDWSRPRRICVIPETARFVMDNVRYFYGLGYWGMLDFATDDYADWSEEQIQTFKDQLTRLAKEYVRQFRLGHVMGNETFNLHGKKLFGGRKMMVGCGAGRGLQAVTWDGYLMPCHRYLGEPRDSEFCGGKLADVLAGSKPAFGQILTDHIQKCSKGEETEECGRCVARKVCQHGCRHLSWVKYGDLSKTPKVRCVFTKCYQDLTMWIHSQIGDVTPPWYDRRPTRCAPIPGDA